MDFFIQGGVEPDAWKRQRKPADERGYLGLGMLLSVGALSHAMAHAGSPISPDQLGAVVRALMA